MAASLYETPPQPSASLYEGEGVPPTLSAATVQNRTQRYHLAMGESSPGQENIANSIQTGQDANLRVAAAQAAIMRTKQRQLDEIERLARQGASQAQARSAVQQYRMPLTVNPDTVMEEGFADRYLSMFIDNENARRYDSATTEAVSTRPQETREALYGTQSVIARQMILQKAMEDTKAKYEGVGWGEYLGALAETFVPGVSGARMSPDWNPLNIAFPGSSIQDERRKFWSFEDHGEAQTWLRGRIADMFQKNPILAVQYAEKMVSMGADETVAFNVFGALDTQTVGGIAAAVGKGAITAAGFRRLLKGSVDAVEDGAVRMDRIAEATGDVKTAARLRTAREVLLNKDETGNTTSILDNLPTLNNPSSLAGPNETNLAREATQRNIAALKTSASDLMQAVNKGNRTQRIPEEVLPAMMNHAEEMARIQHPSIQDGILDVRRIRDRNTNTNHIEIIIGKKDGTLFRNADQAERYARDEYGLTEFYGFKIIGADARDTRAVRGLAQAAAETEAQSAVRKGEARVVGDKIEGFKSIQGLVRLTDGSEIGVANRKDGIFRKLEDGTTVKIDTKDIVAVKSSAKNAKWINVVTDSETNSRLSNIVSANRQGNNWYIRIVKPLDETSLYSARNLLITTNNTNPVSVANWWLGSLARSAEDQLSYFQRSNRHMALHVPQEVQRIMIELSKRIGYMRKESRDALERVLIVNRDYHDYSLPGPQQRGRAYRNQAQLEKEWWEVNGTFPNEQESLAYFTYHQIMDTDWVIRNFGVIRDLLRQGVEEFSVPLTIKGEKTPFAFNGRLEPDLPWSSKSDFGIMVINPDGSTPRTYWRNDLSDAVKSDLKDKINNQGFRVIQVANPADRPFKADTGIKSTVNYVVTPEQTSRPVKMDIVDYAPGVHVMYPQAHFVKQPVIEIGEGGRWIHYGDKTIFAVDTEREAKRLSTAMNKVQEMFRNNKPDNEINDFIVKNLPEDVEYWKRQFFGGDGAEAYLSMDHPVGNTYSGKSFFDTHTEYRAKFQNLREERNSEFNMYRSIDMDFLANRDGPLMTVANRGSYEQPLYALEKARILDPFVSINRTLGNSIRSLYLNDYKIGAIEQWVAQYGHLLVGDTNLHKQNPFQAFYYGQLNTAATDKAALASAQSTKDRIVNFLGVSTELGRDLNHMQQKLMNFLEKGEQTTVLGQPLLPKGTVRWYNDHELPFIKNPVAAIRSMMFDFRFGFFNPAQLIVQSQGLTHAIAVAGVGPGTKGFEAYNLQRFLLKMNENPETLEHVANMATKFGWKKEHFKEAYLTMRQQGLDIIGKEHALRDGAFDPTFFTSRFGRFLESGRFFFKEGEKLTRMVAWNTAYWEWRKANPTKVLDEYGIGAIHNRADDLSANMTKASNSALQEGVFAVPTQFFTFSHRMLEQAWGGRVSGREKLRAFLTHSAIYGAPVALGVAIPWPIYESLRQAAMERGLPVNDKWFELATGGLMNYGVHLATGTEYNVEQRYGPGFPDVFKKAFQGDLSLIEAMGGAAGSFVLSLGKAAYPFGLNMWHGQTGGQDAFPLTKEDIFGVLREISSVNNTYNAIYAYNTGKYFSRNGELIAGATNPLTAKDAAAMVLSLTRRDIADMRLTLGSLKEQGEAQRRAQALGEREYRRALQYIAEGDTRSADTYLARAKVFWTVVGDLRDAQVTQSMSRVHNENIALIDRARQRFTEQGNKSQLPARLQRLIDGR